LTGWTVKYDPDDAWRDAVVRMLVEPASGLSVTLES